MSSGYQDKRLLGVLEGISESLEDIALHLRVLANDRDFYPPAPPSSKEIQDAEAYKEILAECEPCIDMDHQKGYE